MISLYQGKVWSSATKAVNKIALPTFIHIIFFSRACSHSLNRTCFRKWEIFAPLALTTTPKPGKRYKIWQMNCYFKSSTSASNQHERMLHGNLPREPPSRTQPASTSVLHRAKNQITSKGHQICSPLQKPVTAVSPSQWHYKDHCPFFDTKKISLSLIAGETLTIILKLP